LTIGDRIREIAERKSISMYRVAEEGKVSNAYLSDLINNKRLNPSISILRKIAKGLDVPLKDLVN
jgi:XRE family transcriptional regulator of biofilm formation